jgi:peroxin-16
MEIERRAKKLYFKYVDYITNNAETTADIEVLVKYLSYFVSGENFKIPESKVHFINSKKSITGKLTDNNIISEGLFSLSNLLVLFNDQLIRRKLNRNQPFIGSKTEDNVKLFLTILEDVEVLIEFTSEKILGKKKKFIIIFFIQAVK